MSHTHDLHAKFRGLFRRLHGKDGCYNYDISSLDETNMAERHLTPKLGTGKRFESLEDSVSHEKGVHNPAAVAAAIGRKKYGKKKFAKLGEEGKKREEKE